MKNTFRNDFKAALFELISTFFLVLVACGTSVLDEESILPVGILGISLFTGIIVALMILLFGKLSGAHMNPIVSLYLCLHGEISRQKTVFYLFAQGLGAIAAAVVLKLFFPENKHLGMNETSINLPNTFILETFLGFLLVVLLILLSRSRLKLQQFTGVLVGTLIFLEIYLAGPVSGASMNPVRSIAPALMSGNLDHLWIYICAPLTGMVLAVLFFKKNPL